MGQFSRPYQPHDRQPFDRYSQRDYSGPNEPLPLKTADAEPKVPDRPPVDLSPAFKEHHFRNGNFTIAFDVNGEAVSKKLSDGFVILKPRGASAVTRHFVITGDVETASAGLNAKQVRSVLESYFSKSSDYKLAQLHLNLK